MKPRLLLVEDDSISCSFMAAALEALPARVDSASSVSEALASNETYDLWLVDANLPDGRGIDLLSQLRERAPLTPALAHTADDSAKLQNSLLAAGFNEVLVKPASATQLRQAALRLLGMRSANTLVERESTDAAAPLWDHAVALLALGGNRQHVDTLRRMFLDELIRQHDEVVHALDAGNETSAKQVLHQLKASSGFVGAMRLNMAAGSLEKSLTDAETRAFFSTVVRETQLSATQIDP